MTKDVIRNKLKDIRNQLSKEDQQNYSSLITHKLFDMKLFHEAKQLFTYVSFQSEVDTKQIISYSLQNKKKVYAPTVIQKNMSFFEINDVEHLLRSKFGVLEPIADPNLEYNYLANPMEQKLMLMPGLAFDTSGNRIGYGAGYYDRFLFTHRDVNFLKIALAYDFQILEHIVAKEHDIKVDLIITPSKIITINDSLMS